MVCCCVKEEDGLLLREGGGWFVVASKEEEDARESVGACVMCDACCYTCSVFVIDMAVCAAPLGDSFS